MSITLSIIILAKNEENNIVDALKSAMWADEVVLYDTGSTDKTIALARDHGAVVVEDHDWQGFGIARQRAQQHAKSDWVLMLDADERITPELKEEIAQVLTQNRSSEIYALPRLTWFFGRFIRHSGWYPDRKLRLYAKKTTQFDDAMVHENVVVPQDCKVVSLKNNLLHFTYRDMTDYLTKSARYAQHWADQREKRGKKSSLSQAVLHGLGTFIRLYLIRLGVLDGRQGLLLALISAHSTFVKYADLWVRKLPKP